MGPSSAVSARPSLKPTLSASTSTAPAQSRVLAARRHSIRNSLDLTGNSVPLPRTGVIPAVPSLSIMPQSTSLSALHKASNTIAPSPSQASPPVAASLPVSHFPSALSKPAPRASSVNIPSQVTREDPEGLKASTSSPVQISPTSTAVPVSTEPVPPHFVTDRDLDIWSSAHRRI